VAVIVRRLRWTPLLPPGYRVEGFIFDVATGRLEQVEVE